MSENDKDNFYSLETEAATLNMKYDINENLTLVSVTGHRQVNEYRIYDFDASAAPMITIERFNDYEQTSQELRLDGAFEKAKFSAGLYYFNNDFTQDWITGDAFWGILFGGISETLIWVVLAYPDCSVPSGAFAPVYCDTGLTDDDIGGNITQILYETQETTSYAAYAQMDYNLTDDLTLTAGLRWTREEKDFVAGQAYLSMRPDSERETSQTTLSYHRNGQSFLRRLV